MALTGAAAAVGLTGIDVAHFWLTLILLGLGWNFGFVGASAMVLDCHRPGERTRVQSLNDFIVFGTMALGSFASGSLLTTYGWDTVLWVSFAPLALAAVVLLASGTSRRSAAVH
jgi:predicted MFS family arabinose efflux permease